MKSFLVCFVALFIVAVPACAQKPPERDSQIQTVVNGVEQARLERTVRTLAAFPTRHTLSGANGADKAAEYLYQEFSAIGRANGNRLKVEKDTWTQEAGPRVPAPAQLTNVVATLPGTVTPERVIVVSGHYDSRVTDVLDAASPAPGANDDASGVAVVMELARLFAGRQFPCTIVFAAVTGEEQSLLGSAHLAERLTANGGKVEAMFTNDIVGNSRGQDGRKNDKQIRLFSAGYDPAETMQQAARKRSAGTDADSPARTLARAARDYARRYVSGFEVALVYRNDRYGRGGDHTPFLAKGIAAARFTEPNEDWRHQHQNLRTENGTVYGDLPEFVDYAYLSRVARVNAAVIASLASAPVPPANVRLAGDLSPNTTLSWQTGSDTAYVEVVWRKTTAPDWEGVKAFSATTQTATLSLSKDDYLFGVRAVGATGVRGVPVIPQAGPAR